jgi:hypothetical protein
VRDVGDKPTPLALGLFDPRGEVNAMAQPRRLTKWDRISEAERTLLNLTTCGAVCSGCETPLATEGDFARHFIVPDSRYLNVGYCPEKGPIREDGLW